ncbi:hypothetical protein EDB19DRAFT_1906263 [Suillus lakei]|nr:hypothetical protein EDB19DRAFT_1906263 [Suillus lakei]
MSFSFSRREAEGMPPKPAVSWITTDASVIRSNLCAGFLSNRSRCCSGSHAKEDIRNLLEALEFYPFSITILANAAHQNSWFHAVVLKKWDDRHSKVLDHRKGKI